MQAYLEMCAYSLKAKTGFQECSHSFISSHADIEAAATGRSSQSEKSRPETHHNKKRFTMQALDKQSNSAHLKETQLIF